MDSWILKAVMVGLLLMMLAFVFLVSAFAYKIVEDTETCSCVEALEEPIQ